MEKQNRLYSIKQDVRNALAEGDAHALATAINASWPMDDSEESKRARRYLKRTLNTYTAQALCAYELKEGRLIARPVTFLTPEAQQHQAFELKRRYDEDGKRKHQARPVGFGDGPLAEKAERLETVYRPAREHVGRTHGGRCCSDVSNNRMLTPYEVSDVRGSTVRRDGTQRHTGTGFVSHNVNLKQDAYTYYADPKAAKKAKRILKAHRKGDDGGVIKAHRS